MQLKNVLKDMQKNINIENIKIKIFLIFLSCKEVYKADINMLKELINDCGEFRDKVSLKLKNKSYQKNGNYFIAIYKT
jgi:hypothetical protein